MSDFNPNEIILYGLKNCDSCKKALQIIRLSELPVTLVDVRDAPLAKSQLLDWYKQFGADKLINRRSTTWRTLSDAEKNVSGQQDVIKLLLKHPTLMKRPVIIRGNRKVLGFDKAALQALANPDG